MTKTRLSQTPSQTIGPFFAYSLTPEQYGYDFVSIAHARLAGSDTAGTPIRIEGAVLDGAGAPITDALIEIWQADASGRYPGAGGANTAFTGFGRCGTDSAGRFAFDTVKPGAIAGQAPFINVTVLMRGLLMHLFTRLYFADEGAANAADPVLAQVAPERRATLIAAFEGNGRYRFDIHMQGPNETVFFDM